jgi:hypothetical protein
MTKLTVNLNQTIVANEMCLTRTSDMKVKILESVYEMDVSLD